VSSSLLKVGELSRRAGVTVRTLHFYDEIGLLKPSSRGEYGHRLYETADVARLQQVTSLRALGFTLEEIGDLLDGREGSALSVLQRHISHLDAQIEQARRLKRLLERMSERLEATESLSVDDLLLTIKETNMFEKYYTAELLETLKARREALGEAGMAKAQQGWTDLIAEVKVEKDKGTPPEDPVMQALAGRWQAMIEGFTGGDSGIRENLGKLWEGEDMSHSTGIDTDLMGYVAQALAARG